MKRFISTFLILFIFVGGVAAMADIAEASTTENTLRLNYSQIERLVRRDNLTIRNNEITIQNINNMINNDGMVSNLMDSANQLRAMQSSTEIVLARLQLSLDPSQPLDPVTMAIIQSLTNDVVSYEMNIRQISGQIDQMQTAPQASLTRTIQQLNNVNRQIIWGAESLFMGYHALTRQLDISNETLKTLNRNIEIMERRLSLGQITARSLQSIRNNRTQLEQGIRTMEHELGNLKGQINMLLGRNHNALLELGALPAAERGFLDTIDRTRDLRAAMRSNHLLNIALIEIDEQSRLFSENARVQEAIARNNYDSEVRALEQRYENLIRAIADREDQLELAESQLELLQQTLEETKRRFNRGLVSRVELEQAESEVLLQTIRVNGADAELYAAIQRYEWLLRGLSV